MRKNRIRCVSTFVLGIVVGAFCAHFAIPRMLHLDVATVLRKVEQEKRYGIKYSNCGWAGRFQVIWADCSKSGLTNESHYMLFDEATGQMLATIYTDGKRGPYQKCVFHRPGGSSIATLIFAQNSQSFRRIILSPGEPGFVPVNWEDYADDNADGLCNTYTRYKDTRTFERMIRTESGWVERIDRDKVPGFIGADGEWVPATLPDAGLWVARTDDESEQGP
ncbi:MAG: hypothetical protein HUU22_09035 [Phycisphaerae bacterium]|nr:hypothetical protein [Phycisphaerae bacterium]NUQ46166.1 hypothetical protein [Phycisphaerae bacterium]